MKKILFIVIIIACSLILILWYRNHTTRTFPVRMKNTNEFNSKFIFDDISYYIYLEDYIYDGKYYRFEIKNEKFESLLYGDFVSSKEQTLYAPSLVYSMIKYYNGKDKIVLDNSDTLFVVKPVQGILKDSL